MPPGRGRADRLRRTAQGSVLGATVGGLGLSGQKILREDEQGDTHQSQGHASLTIAGDLQGAGDLKMLRPAQAHPGSQVGVIRILENADQCERRYNLKH